MSDDRLWSVDAELRRSAATDFGQLTTRTPAVVASPITVEESASVLERCHREGRPTVVQGTGHGCYGQSLTDGGVVLRTGQMAAVSLEGDLVRAGAGATWSTLLERCQSGGRLPLVMPDYLPLSVGGTLVAGGVGASSFRHGLAADTVVECRGVGLDGRVLESVEARSLLGRPGRGLLVEATLATGPDPGHLHLEQTLFAGVDDLLAAQVAAAADPDVLFIEGSLMVDTAEAVAIRFPGLSYPLTVRPSLAPWYGVLRVARVAPAPAPGPPAGGLVVRRSAVTTLEALSNRSGSIDMLRRSGMLGGPNPWVCGFLPADRAVSELAAALAEVDPADLRWGRLLVQAMTLGPGSSLGLAGRWLFFGFLVNLSGLDDLPGRIERWRRIALGLQAAGSVPYLGSPAALPDS